jgi:hypothetical protein
MFRRQRAGHSADRIFRAARSQWRRSLWPVLVVMAAMAAAIAVPLWLWFPHGTFFAGLFVGSMGACMMWAWDDPPQVVERWRMGRDGERKTAKELRKLERDGWYVLHDLPGERGNLDHVVVGPGGVFLLDSKVRAGKLVIEDGVLTCLYPTLPTSDYTMPGLPWVMKARARELRNGLKAHLGWIVDVEPVVVLWAEFEESRGFLDGVTVLHGSRLAATLRERTPRIADVDLEPVRRALRAVTCGADVGGEPEGRAATA